MPSPIRTLDQRVIRARLKVAREAGHALNCALAFSRRTSPVLSRRCLCRIVARLTLAQRWLTRRRVA